MKKKLKSEPVFNLTRKDALKLVKNYKEQYNQDGRGTVHVTFTADEVNGFLSVAKELSSDERIRFYLGAYDEKDLDASGNRKATVVIVSAKQYDDDSVVELTKTNNPRDFVALNFGTLCPPQCNTVDINSLGYEVYESAGTSTPAKRATKSGKKPSPRKR